VECGSIRAAARKLGVAQPTITKSVRSLEAEVHVQLLDRSSRGIVPTKPGRAFFTRARLAQSELRKAEDEAAQLGGSSAGAVTFGIGPAAVGVILPTAIARFRKQFPRARVRVAEGLAHALLPSVRDETLDFVIGLRPWTRLDPALKFRPLYRSELVVVARKGHPLAQARSLSELARADWLTTATHGLPEAPLERFFQAAGLQPPQPSVQCSSYAAGAAIAAKSDMLGIVLRRMLTEPWAPDSLQEIAVAESIPAVTAGIFTRSDTPMTKVAASMAKAVASVASELAKRG
jgi:LysR family transcriptional regulator, regulator of abg operon